MKKQMDAGTFYSIWLLIAALVLIAGVFAGAYKSKPPTITRVTDGVPWMPVNDVPYFPGEF